MNESTAKRVTRYVAVTMRWLAVTVGVFALTAFSGFYVMNNVIEKMYVANALLVLPAADLAIPEANPLLDEPDPQPEFANIMMSPDFLLAVVKELKLDKEWARRLNGDEEQLPDVDALTRMGKVVHVYAKPGSNLVTITATSDMAQEAADIANAMADRYKAGREAGENPALENREVQIVERATAPTYPVRPNKRLDSIVTWMAAVFFGLTAASFVEMVYLFIRAGEREEN